MTAYEMAATVEFGLDAKQGLLDLRSETARLRLVTRLFRAAVRRLDFVERAQARARSNGKVHFGALIHALFRARARATRPGPALAAAPATGRPGTRAPGALRAPAFGRERLDLGAPSRSGGPCGFVFLQAPAEKIEPGLVAVAQVLEDLRGRPPLAELLEMLERGVGEAGARLGVLAPALLALAEPEPGSRARASAPAGRA